MVKVELLKVNKMQSIKFNPIPFDPLLNNSLLHYSIDLVGIEDFINHNNPLKLWSLYIPPSSNPLDSLIEIIFSCLTIIVS